MERDSRKLRQGEVISDKMDKTVVVRVTRQVRHPIYGKLTNKWKKYYAHDEKNLYKQGQVVKIKETRPLSRTKRWRVVEAIGERKDKE